MVDAAMFAHSVDVSSNLVYIGRVQKVASIKLQSSSFLGCFCKEFRKSTNDLLFDFDLFTIKESAVQCRACKKKRTCAQFNQQLNTDPCYMVLKKTSYWQ
jgi:hypothetical protein